MVTLSQWSNLQTCKEGLDNAELGALLWYTILMQHHGS